jgi:hypothetical protein
MRLLEFGSSDELRLTKDASYPTGSYAILSHTWAGDADEVTFDDLKNGTGKGRSGYAKLLFCGKQAKTDGLSRWWVDSACINKSSSAELSEAINSMYRWYKEAARCYVFLADVSVPGDQNPSTTSDWHAAFKASRWFTRGWTLQEMLAPTTLHFFSREGQLLGDRYTLEATLLEITGIPVAALRGTSLATFPVDERLRWAEKRDTTRIEDKAYCLLGIFHVFMSPIYMEGDNAFKRLRHEIRNLSAISDVDSMMKRTNLSSKSSSTHKYWFVGNRIPNPLFAGRNDTMDELDELIQPASEETLRKDQCSTIVVSGMGGQGNSELCLQAAHRYRNK